MIDPSTTTPPAEASRLLAATHLGMLGDTHGDIEHVFTLSRIMAGREIRALVVLGNFGFVWPDSNSSRNLDRIAKHLADRFQTLFFVDGNHEDFPRQYKFPIADDGLRYIRRNIVHIPRGTRLTLSSGMVLAALGGANSADRHHRTPGKNWWPGEAIDEADLEALGNAPADILIGHEAPIPFPALDRHLAEVRESRGSETNECANEGRKQFTRGFMQVRPRLYLGGHYHRHLDETLRYGAGDDAFDTRVVTLDMNGRTGVNSAVLNVTTLELEFLDRADFTVMELRGNEKGRWRVHTRDSTQIFDFDHGTVERVPGPNARAKPDDHPRRLLGINRCRVGERGYWDLKSYEYFIDSYWAVSSLVQRIERISPEQEIPTPTDT